MFSRYLTVVLLFLFLRIDSIETENLFNTGTGTGFLVDPFLELTAGVTSPPDLKSTKSEPTCLSQGSIASAVICTLLLCTFAGFLIWLVYLRQKFNELRLYQNQDRKYVDSYSEEYIHTTPSSHMSNNYQKSNKKERTYNGRYDHQGNPLPLDVTDYKFGTFPFRQSQTPSGHGHYNHTDWLNRIPSSFRSVNVDQDTEMLDVELLDPTFSGLNFSITGNMRAGIFVKEILEKENADGSPKQNPCDRLRAGDRIMALTVCFQSIVYEDALTILSYASPYPVILRVQRPIQTAKVNVTNEKRSPVIHPTSKVKWRDDFEHYDNDTSISRSMTQHNQSITLSNDTKPILSSKKPQDSNSNANRSAHQNKTKTKPNKSNTSQHALTSSGGVTKRPKMDPKKHRTKQSSHQVISTEAMLMSTGLSAKPLDKSLSSGTPATSTNKKSVKSVTNAVMSYLHYRGSNGGQASDHVQRADGTIVPYYDSPYDYYYDGHHPQLNRNNNNNNNSLSLESLTAVKSIYTLQFSESKDHHSSQRPLISRRCQRRLSSPAILLTASDNCTNPLDTIDTFS